MPHPDQLGSMLTASQLAEWRAYTALRPWGERAADYRAAMQAVIAVNVNRAKGRPPKELTDFVLFDDAKVAAEMQYQDDPALYFRSHFGALISG